jgi:lipopolysaccharide export system permease protein
VAVGLNDIAFSWGYQGLHRVVLQSVEEIAYGVLRTQRTYSTDRFAISVKAVEGKRLIRPTITFAGSGDTPTVTITAEEARLQSNLRDNTLSIFLTNSVVEAGDQFLGVFPETHERIIPLSEASKKGAGGNPSNLSMLGGIGDARREQKQHIHRLEESLAAEAGFALVTGDFAGLREEAWQHRRNELDDARNHLNRLNTEPWRRFAAGFSCLCFCCVGVPLAVWRKSADYMTNFAVCFLPILGFYFPIFYTTLQRSKAGAFPPMTLWVGNLVCMGVGYWLLRRVLRH